jgi:hypothetical protein
MTATVTVQHGQVAVFVPVDHYSAKCVGIHAALEGTRHEALEPVRQGVKARFGAIGQVVAAGLSLRRDHGSQYMSDDFQREIRWSGMFGAALGPVAGWPLTLPGLHPGARRQRLRRARSPWRSNRWRAHGSLRTVKENLLRVRTFETVEELRQALTAFRETCNEHWLIERHGHRSPARFRRDQLDSQPMAA